MNDKQNVILKAMGAVEMGASISAAARQYGIPRSTLDDKIRGRYPVECSKGPATVLSKEEENHLKRWIIFMADSGFPITKAQLLDSVSLLIKKMKRNNPFQNDRPGRHWFEAFIKRHPEVGQRVAQNLTQTRALVKENNLRMWFTEVQDYFVSSQLEEAIQDPRRIFNCDESAFFLSPSDNRVLAKRGAKNVYNIIPSSEKECVTVLITANAAGNLAPPMVLFKLKSIPHKISKTAPKDWGLGFTPKGWMTGESFYEYIANVFFPWLEKSDIPLPIIFFLDGHCSHTTLPLSNYCREKSIQLVALYPNATHLIQPMDVAVFRPLKRLWKKSVYDWRNENHFIKLKKEDFCPLLEKTLKQLDPNSIKNGFRKCGLSPFDANSVDYSKCVTSHSKTITEPNTNNQRQLDNDAHFKFFESQINPENLKAFYANESSTWEGEKSLEGLYNVWRQINTKNKNLPLDTLNNSSTTLKMPTQETFNTNECQSFGDICNLTGLTDILNTNEVNDYIMENEIHNYTGNVGNIEVYEKFDGILTKIIDITPNDLSTINFGEREKNSPEQQIQKKIHNLTGQVIRTKGSEPIYITSSKTITANTGMTSEKIIPYIKTTSNLTETVTMIHSSLSSHMDSTVELFPIQKDMLTQTFSNNEVLHITPPTRVSPLFKKKDELTSIIDDDKMPDALNKIKTTTHTTTQLTTPHTPLTQALLEHDNCNQSKTTKYYGDLVVPTPFKDALFWPETPNISTKSRVKVPSVITSDRWQIFAQKKNETKIKKQRNKAKPKDKFKINKLGNSNTKPKKKLLDNKTVDPKSDDWFCRLCQTSTKLDMIECVTCKTWYHTSCAEVSPNEITFTCMYCYVSFEE